MNFDVLAQPNVEFGARVPVEAGVRLWADLFETHRGRLVLVADYAPSVAVLDHWLMMNGIKPSLIDILDSDDPVIKADKVQRLMLSNGAADWYVDIDPETVAICLRMGITSLLLTIPYVLRPEWNTGRTTTRSWDAVVEEINDQASIRMDRALLAEGGER